MYNPLLLALIGALIVGTAGAIACASIVELHQTVTEFAAQEQERTNDINSFIIKEFLDQ